MSLIPLPALQDNDVWPLNDTQRAPEVAPRDAGPGRKFHAANRLQLGAILVTPHHAGRSGGPHAARDLTAAHVQCAREWRPRPLVRLHASRPAKLEFATAVEPGHTQLSHSRQQCGQRRSPGERTPPSSTAVEKSGPPFLRTARRAVARAAHQHDGADEADQVAVFAALRQWKNEFR